MFARALITALKLVVRLTVTSKGTFLKIYFWSESLNRSSQQRFYMKKGVLKNFANFPEKHLCQALFLIKLEALGL